MYSSTAAVIVLAKKSRLSPAAEVDAARAILLAVSMMYLRLLALVVIFQPRASAMAAAPLLVLALLAAVYGFWLRAVPREAGADGEVHVFAEPELRRNPLELNAAALFAVLFVAVSYVTKVVLEYFRDTGLMALSFLVGFSDITPFVVSVLQGTLGLEPAQMLQSVVIASASNNLLKTAYTFGLGARRTTTLVFPGLVGLAVLSLAYAAIAF